jgi:hypothetical protein
MVKGKRKDPFTNTSMVKINQGQRSRRTLGSILVTVLVGLNRPRLWELGSWSLGHREDSLQTWDELWGSGRKAGGC